jgi:hypothetical protein
MSVPTWSIPLGIFILVIVGLVCFLSLRPTPILAANPTNDIPIPIPPPPDPVPDYGTLDVALVNTDHTPLVNNNTPQNIVFTSLQVANPAFVNNSITNAPSKFDVRRPGFESNLFYTPVFSGPDINITGSAHVRIMVSATGVANFILNILWQSNTTNIVGQTVGPVNVMQDFTIYFSANLTPAGLTSTQGTASFGCAVTVATAATAVSYTLTVLSITITEPPPP